MTEGHEGDLRPEHPSYEARLRELGLLRLKKAPGGPYSNPPVPKVRLQESWRGSSYSRPITQKEKAWQNVAEGPRGDWVRSWKETLPSFSFCCRKYLTSFFFFLLRNVKLDSNTSKEYICNLLTNNFF